MKAKHGEYGPRQDFLRKVLDGNAPRTDGECILWPYAKNSKGYPHLTIDGERKYVGAWVLLETEGPRPENYTVGHAPHEVCGNRHCVAPEHLSWQSYTEQQVQVRDDRGRRFSDAQVREAVLRAQNGESQQSVADDYGVHKSTVNWWVNGRSRKRATAGLR